MHLDDVLAQFGTKLNFSLVLFAVGLLMCRILPVLVLSPFLGGEVVPTEVKIGIGVTLSIVLFPVIAGRINSIPISAIPYVSLMLKELFLGVSLAFVVSLVFEAARVAGTMADTMS